VPGAVILVVGMVLAVPVGVMLVGALWSAVFGWLESKQGDAASPHGT
jgi:hypothetical protein